MRTIERRGDVDMIPDPSVEERLYPETRTQQRWHFETMIQKR